MTVTSHKHVMKLAFRQCLATADINIFGVGGKIIALAFFWEREYFLEVVSGLFCLVCDRNFSFHNAVILKFAAKLQHESANVWHSRKEKEIFHKRVIFSSSGFEDRISNPYNHHLQGLGSATLVDQLCGIW